MDSLSSTEDVCFQELLVLRSSETFVMSIRMGGLENILSASYQKYTVQGQGKENACTL